jgi:hypothetical protein
MSRLAQWCGVLTCHSTFCTTVWTVIAQWLGGMAHGITGSIAVLHNCYAQWCGMLVHHSTFCTTVRTVIAQWLGGTAHNSMAVLNNSC